MDNILDVCQIFVQQGDFCLEDISFSVKKGYITGLVGRNGSGKTTLINAICDAIALKDGTITIKDENGIRSKAAIKQDLGIVMEEFTYFKNYYSIWENADMLAPLYRNWDNDVLYYYLKKYGIITGKESYQQKYGNTRRSLASYSKGEQVKIRLAFALAHKPRLLLLDEPTANLDPVFCREFLEDLQELIDCPYWFKDADFKEQEQQRLGVVLCTHITSEIDCIGDYVLLLDNGRLLLSGERDALFQKYQVRNTKELVLKLTGNEEGFVFGEREKSNRYEEQKITYNNKNGQTFLQGDVPVNTEGLRKCEEVIYKSAKAGRIGCGWAFVLYLFSIGINLYLCRRGFTSMDNFLLWFIMGFFISWFANRYFINHTNHWDDSLKENIAYLPITLADVKLCLREQTKRLLVFWILVQGTVAVLIGLISIVSKEQLPYLTMAVVLFVGMLCPIYSAFNWFLDFRNKHVFLSMELVFFIAGLLIIFLI